MKKILIEADNFHDGGEKSYPPPKASQIMKQIIASITTQHLLITFRHRLQLSFP